MNDKENKAVELGDEKLAQVSGGVAADGGGKAAGIGKGSGAADINENNYQVIAP